MVTNNKDTRIGIVTVNYNDFEVTKRCIESIDNNTKRVFKVVVVDNSTDTNEKNRLRKYVTEKDNIKFIDAKENSGFCKGTNIGTKYAISVNCTHILWLNNDTILDKNCIENLENSITNNPKSLITGKIFYADNLKRIWYAGGKLNFVLGIGKHFGFRKQDNSKFDEFKKITYLTGCFISIPVGILAEVGLLNEKLFMYLDDTEYSMRLYKRKVPIYYDPKIKLAHDVGAGKSLLDYSALYLYLSTRNRPHVTNNVFYKTYLIFVTLILSLAKILILILRQRKEPLKKIKAIVMGLIDIFRFSKKRSL